MPPAYLQIIVNGQEEALVSFKGTVDQTFTYYYPKIKGGDRIEVVLFTEGKKEVVRQTLQVNTIEKVEITSLDVYKQGKSEWITGTVKGSAGRYMQLFVNGKRETTVTSGELTKGKLSYYRIGLKTTDQVEIVLYDKSYNEVARKKVIIES
ncbi:hypothetical protein PTB14_12025 [Enterococcus faecalis]|uniref:immunoglobulin-like domain-containing protein n=1 Tax=Enterococcus faecalis TaxID=1351 RepID=UPI00235FA08D|nr:immunoglobulin-like domain-containing protein [Enterococcus faecalis]MDD0851142.1 hypothetical protein [Enterococcus faecalis]